MIDRPGALVTVKQTAQCWVVRGRAVAENM